MVEQEIILEAVRNIEGETLLDKLIAVFPDLDDQARKCYDNSYIDWSALKEQGVIVGEIPLNGNVLSAGIFSK